MDNPTKLPFHGGNCYACWHQARGLRDLRPEGGSLVHACTRHKDPTIEVFKACKHCNEPIEGADSRIIDGEYVHTSCHNNAGNHAH